MKKLIALFTFSLLAPLAHADYIYDAKSLDRWQRLDNRTILLSRGSTPKAVVRLGCVSVFTTSRIVILTDTLGNHDGKILVDNEVCDVWEVKKIS